MEGLVYCIVEGWLGWKRTAMFKSEWVGWLESDCRRVLRALLFVCVPPTSHCTAQICMLPLVSSYSHKSVKVTSSIHPRARVSFATKSATLFGKKMVDNFLPDISFSPYR